MITYGALSMPLYFKNIFLKHSFTLVLLLYVFVGTLDITDSIHSGTVERFQGGPLKEIKEEVKEMKVSYFKK